MTAHKRIRPFNTKDTYPEQKLDNDLCQAVVAGNTVFLRGQVSQDLDTRESLHVGDAGTDRQDHGQHRMLMEEAGGHMDHICRIVVYLTDVRYRQDVYREMGKWLKGVFPCLNRPGHHGAGAARMGRGNRSHRRHPGWIQAEKEAKK